MLLPMTAQQDVVSPKMDIGANIRAMSEWIVEDLGQDVPLHFTRFHPSYSLTDLPLAPIETLEWE